MYPRLRILWTLLMLALTATCAISAPIHDAAGKDQVSKVQALLKKNPKLLNARDKDGATPLHYAVSSGKTGVLKLLLSKNAQVNLTRKDGATPLHIAVVMARKDIIDLLVKNGAKADLSNMIVAYPKGAAVMRNGKNLAGIQKGSVLKVGDMISGGTKGNLDLIVGSFAAVRVKPGARIRIQKAVNNKDGVDVQIRLGKGTVLTRLRKLTGQSRFIMETPGAVAAARGTAYLTRYTDNRTEVLVAEGKVAVSLLNTPTQEVEVGASQKVVVEKILPSAATNVTQSDSGTMNELLSVKPPQDPTPFGWMINPKDGAEMVWVPAGEFVMGSTEAQVVNLQSGDSSFDVKWRRNEMPQHIVYLDGYWMYKYEVTVAQYRQFCSETGTPMPEAPEWGWIDNHPMVNVTWQEAADYAKWASGSLPTEAQWEKAARGTDGQIYPWGNEWDTSKCNNALPRPFKTDHVGSYPSGASPYGCMDIAGSVWEWCADWYPINYNDSGTRNPTGPADSLCRVYRGGSMYEDQNYIVCRCAFRGGDAPTVRQNTLGFRCAKNP